MQSISRCFAAFVLTLAAFTSAFAADEEVSPQSVAEAASSNAVAPYKVPKPSSPFISIPDTVHITPPDADLPQNLRDYSGAWEGVFPMNGTHVDALLVIQTVAPDALHVVYFINKKMIPLHMKPFGDGFAAELPGSKRLMAIRLINGRFFINVGGTKTEFTKVVASPM